EENGAAFRRLLLMASVLIVVLAVGAHRVAALVDARTAIVLTAVVGGAGLLLAMWCYGIRWPRASLAVVAMTGAIAFTTGRARVGPFVGPAVPDYTAFAARIRDTLDIESVSAMRWLSEPDPRLVFNTHQTYDQVLPDLEVLRELRKRDLAATEANAERLVAEAALKQLDTPEPVVAVARAKLLEAKVESAPFLELAHTVYRHPSFDGDPDDDLVVFVNEAGARLVRTHANREIQYPVATTSRRVQP
ncbi:MAG: hypothetical protein JXA69_18015, partial [Phycisphaerae bacterium]|nr:hypothetical protein [Phycisphaerae bacterium]